VAKRRASSLSVSAASGAFSLRASATPARQPAATGRSPTRAAAEIGSTQALASGPGRATSRTGPCSSAGVVASAVSSPRPGIAHQLAWRYAQSIPYRIWAS